MSTNLNETTAPGNGIEHLAKWSQANVQNPMHINSKSNTASSELIDTTLSLQSTSIKNLLESQAAAAKNIKEIQAAAAKNIKEIEEWQVDAEKRFNTIEKNQTQFDVSLKNIKVPDHLADIDVAKKELLKKIKEHNKLVNEFNKHTVTPVLNPSMSPAAARIVTAREIEKSRIDLMSKAKAYMNLVSDDSGIHSSNILRDAPAQLQASLRKLQAALYAGHTLTQNEIACRIDTESWFSTPSKMIAFNSVLRLADNPRLKNLVTNSPKDLYDMTMIISDITDAYCAVVKHQPFFTEEDTSAVTVSRFVADDAGGYCLKPLSEDDMLIQDYLMKVIVGEYDDEGKKTINGLMDDVIAVKGGMLGSESDTWKMVGTILKITGYVLLALVALTTVLTMTGVTFPAMLVSLAVTAQASFIVNQSIHAVTALVAMFGIKMSAGAAVATTAGLSASAVTLFGKAAQVYGGPSKLMQDKNQAANDIADVARSLTMSAAL